MRLQLLCGVIVAGGMLSAADVSAAEEKTEVTFVIRTLPSQMKYEQTDLVVAPGQTVRIVLKNDDQLPHNLVVLRERGSALPVAMKAWELGERGFEKQWIPDDPRVLAWTKMTDPGKEESLSFRAPDTEGDLDFVCTFPGHATIMNGVVHVTNAPRPGLSNLTYMLYKGSWDKLPDFNALPIEAKVRTDEINDGIIDLGVAQMDDGFGLVFDGTLNVPADGRYRFFLASDDGSRLSIDGQPVIVHDGIHGGTQRRAQVALTKGPHPLQLTFFEQRRRSHPGARLERSRRGEAVSEQGQTGRPAVRPTGAGAAGRPPGDLPRVHGQEPGKPPAHLGGISRATQRRLRSGPTASGADLEG